MMPYIFIAVFILLYAVAFAVAYRDLERSYQARYFCKLRKQWPHSLYTRQYLADMGANNFMGSK